MPPVPKEREIPAFAGMTASALRAKNRRFLRNQHGAVIVEFALIFPMLFLLTVGGIELARYIHLHNKLEQTIFTTGDMLARHNFVAAKEIDATFRLVDYVMFPFTNAEKYTLIVSAIRNNARPGSHGRDLRVMWQYHGMGTLEGDSIFGKATQRVSGSFPHAELLQEPQSLILAVEIRYAYAPLLFSTLLPETVLHRSIILRPLFRN